MRQCEVINQVNSWAYFLTNYIQILPLANRVAPCWPSDSLHVSGFYPIHRRVTINCDSKWGVNMKRSSFSHPAALCVQLQSSLADTVLKQVTVTVYWTGTMAPNLGHRTVTTRAQQGPSVRLLPAQETLAAFFNLWGVEVSVGIFILTLQCGSM